MYSLFILGLILIVTSSLFCLVFFVIFGGQLIENLSYDISMLRSYKRQENDNAIKEYTKETRRDLLKFGIPILIACVVLGICIPFGVHSMNSYKMFAYDKVICEIVSLNRQSDIEGSFFLGTGRVESKEYYYFYTPTNKGYKLEKRSHERTYIVEDDSVSPCLKEVKETNNWYEYYVLVVPTNTVVKEFHA